MPISQKKAFIVPTCFFSFEQLHHRKSQENSRRRRKKNSRNYSSPIHSLTIHESGSGVRGSRPRVIMEKFFALLSGNLWFNFLMPWYDRCWVNEEEICFERREALFTKRQSVLLSRQQRTSSGRERSSERPKGGSLLMVGATHSSASLLIFFFPKN